MEACDSEPRTLVVGQSRNHVADDQLRTSVHERFGEGRILGQDMQRISHSATHGVANEGDEAGWSGEADANGNINPLRAQPPQPSCDWGSGKTELGHD